MLHNDNSIIEDIESLDIDLEAYREMRMKHRLSLSDYAFLSVCLKFQSNNNDAWCEPKIKNYFGSVTALKNHISRLVGQQSNTTEIMFKRLVAKGFIEKGEHKFRVTAKFNLGRTQVF